MVHIIRACWQSVLKKISMINTLVITEHNRAINVEPELIALSIH